MTATKRRAWRQLPRIREECVITRDSPDEPLTGVDCCAFAAFWQYGLAARTTAATVGAPNGGRGADLTIFAGIWTHSSVGTHDRRASHAGAGGGCGRSSAISRKISWNICRGMATAAIWKATKRPWLTPFAPILISVSLR